MHATTSLSSFSKAYIHVSVTSRKRSVGATAEKEELVLSLVFELSPS